MEQWDDNGSYTVTEDIVPGVGDKANEGYKAGDWDRTPIDAIITKTTSAEERTFTYTYTEDKTQTKEISYTVKHICRDTGEQIGETEKVTELVWINSADTTLNVKDITLRSKMVMHMTEIVWIWSVLEKHCLAAEKQSEW